MTAQAILWWSAGGAAALTVLAGLAEYLRARRRNLDRVGWMPWQLISILALFSALGLTALALHS